MNYIDDPDQLPALPDPGPRDGRHGVDCDEEYDPYPTQHMGFDTVGGALSVSIEDAKSHLALLLVRVESGEEIVLTRNGHPVARLVSHVTQSTGTVPASPVSEPLI